MLMPWERSKPVADSMPEVPTHCPNPSCRAIEFMDIRPAYRSVIKGGALKLVECGRCVACLRCDTPYVICPHEPGGVIPRKRMAMGLPIPEPRRAAERDGNSVVADLAGTIMDEPA
jgi:hypothetical protein